MTKSDYFFPVSSELLYFEVLQQKANSFSITFQHPVEENLACGRCRKQRSWTMFIDCQRLELELVFYVDRKLYLGTIQYDS